MDRTNLRFASRNSCSTYLGTSLVDLFTVHLGTFTMGGVEVKLVENLPIWLWFDLDGWPAISVSCGSIFG